MPKRPNKFIPVTFAALAALSALVLMVPGCGDDPTGCYDYASFKSDAPAVSFATDVVPILRQSCGLSNACHGNQSGPVGQPYLGPSGAAAASPAEIAAILAQNVGVASTKAATMKIVEAGSPETSFLMHKMDDTITSCADVKCEAGCGVSMPLGSPILAVGQRDTVRRWIAQGAKND